MANKILIDRIREQQVARQKASKEQEAAIQSYIDNQVSRFDQVNKELDYYQRELRKLQTQRKYTKEGSEEYKKLKEQINNYEYTVNGLAVQKNAIAKALVELGQQELVNLQEAKAADEAVHQRVIDTQEEVNAAKARIDSINEQIKAISSKPSKSKKDIADLESLQKELSQTEKAYENAKADQESAIIAEKADPALKAAKAKKQGVKDNLEAISKTGLPTWIQHAVGAAITPEHESITGEVIGKFSDAMSQFGAVGGIIGGIGNTVAKILDVAMAVRKDISGWVDEAASVLANNVGRINAALEGTGKTWEDSFESMIDSMGLSRYVKQTDYIAQIANLTSRGITFDVEQRALLETIKDKTLASFSSMEGSLLRLVRLKQTDVTNSQFGLEVALRNTLNKVFKDSTYLSDMFNGIQSAITDAVMISGEKDATEYSSVIQTWMGSMYESGIDSSTVTKLANAINALGSGNVSALSSDADMQRLILLSMDTIGMDFADILQQGLNTQDITNLLTAVVKYLTEIEGNTKNNNVLTSSYTQLFGMSMADLQGFKNLSNKMSELTYVDNSTASKVTTQELALLQSTNRTTVAEQIQNAFDNAKFTFGAEIAKDESSYISWKVSNLILDVVDQVVNSSSGPVDKGIKSIIAKVVGFPAEAAIYANEFKGILGLAKSLPSLLKGGESGTLNTIIEGGDVSYGGNSRSSKAMAVTTNKSSFKTVMSSILHSGEFLAEAANFDFDWNSDKEEEDETLTELKKITGALVTAEANAAHKAIATYLVGMTDDTLRSFASIFADENAMTDTFGGENNTLKENLFKYADDTTSNSTAESGTTSTPTTKAL